MRRRGEGGGKGGDGGGKGEAIAGRVSIVVPVYNTAPCLRECIDSALNCFAS